ncbi:MAG TPA: phosphatase PAP2 family protein [Acidimicrobiia bacterium]
MTQQPNTVDLLLDLDETIFRQVADWKSPILDGTLPSLSEIASYSRIWIGVSLGLTAFGGAKGRRSAVLGMAAIGVTSALTNIALKGVTNRKRPQREVPAARRLVHPESTSFPSGHTASAAAFSGVVGREMPGLWLPLNALAGLVGFSRIYTGVHYPGDVLAGWLVGKLVAAMVRWVSRRFRRLQPATVQP